MHQHDIANRMPLAVAVGSMAGAAILVTAAAAAAAMTFRILLFLESPFT
jgi:hypothetical protein